MNKPSSRSSPAVVILLFVVVLVFLYFSLFAVILIDEMVLGTYYISKALPAWCEEVFRVIYWPLIGR